MRKSTGILYYYGFFHIATDIMILIIPIPFLLKLQLGRAKKISLLVIFGLGFGCCIISLIRVIELFQVTYNGITNSLVFGAYWTMLEPALAIFIVSAPVMMPVFGRIPGIPSVLRTVAKRSQGTGTSRSFQKIDDNKATLSNSNLTKGMGRGDVGNSAEHMEHGPVEEHLDEYTMKYMEPKVLPPYQGITRTKTVSQSISHV